MVFRADTNVVVVFFFFKQKAAYEVRISDWSSDVCSSDLPDRGGRRAGTRAAVGRAARPRPAARRRRAERGPGDPAGDRKSVVEGKSVSVSVDIGGRRISRKKTESIRQTASNSELLRMQD